MIRMVQNTSPEEAKRYFSEALIQADYYISASNQELQGRFCGRLADRLTITGPTTKEAFYALCENKDRVTGNPLTPITRDKRITGYDINFHCPKSVSILHALSNDDHILHAFQDSVTQTMQDIEADAKTRVRKKGVYDDRTTGSLVWGEFIHQTARPVDGHTPDPHLHAHCFVFNATWDDEERRVKAAKFRDINRSMPFYQARYYKRFADNLSRLGYRIRLTKHSFEIEGVPKEVIAHFSKRTNEIGRIAKEKGITDAKKLDALGAKTRGKKQKGSMEELKADWLRQINGLNLSQETDGKAIRYGPDKNRESITVATCINHAMLHCFERASVVTERHLQEMAYQSALGQTDVSLDDLTAALENDKRIIRIRQGSQTLCTTKEVLQEEKRMVTLARKSMGKLKPLRLDFLAKENDQQELAISEVLTSTNRVCIIRGAAGSGKTTLMRKAISLIEDTGKKVTVVAPTAAASRGVLKSEGYKDAETVAKLLTDTQLQKQLKDAVLWVDEAGLLGTKDMLALLQLATKQNTRLILGGDTRQHSAVVRGDALRILNTVANIPTAEVNIIRRQENEAYKAAVEDLAKGHIAPAFAKLDAMGAIKTIDPDKPNDELVNRYIDARRNKRTALVVSPTHAQGESVTADIRQELRKAGMIGKKEIQSIRYINLNLTEAQKNDSRNFEKGQMVQFNQNVKGMNRGTVWLVGDVEDNKVQLYNAEGETRILPRNEAKHFDVFSMGAIALSKGDKVRITRNSYDASAEPKTNGKVIDKTVKANSKPKRMDNGLALEVVSVSHTGQITMRNPVSKIDYVIDKNFGHITHDYCVTSHASQGKTVDEVLIVQPSSTFGATNAKQFYVSVSRGKHLVSIFTDDRAALLENAQELGERQSALELVSNKDAHTDFVLQRQRQEKTQINTKEQDEINTLNRKDRGYEPSI